MDPTESREEISTITDNEAREIGTVLGVDYNVIPFEWWKKGMEVELEHGSKHGKISNVTHDDLLSTGMIAMAHLIEFPDYYQRLEVMEENARKEWAPKYKALPYNNSMVKNDDWWILQAITIAVLIFVVIFLVYKLIDMRKPNPVETFATPEIIQGDPIRPGTY